MHLVISIFSWLFLIRNKNLKRSFDSHLLPSILVPEISFHVVDLVLLAVPATVGWHLNSIICTILLYLTKNEYENLFKSLLYLA